MAEPVASTSRASRRKRVRGRGARLRDRDLDILLALARMRLLRTSDITRLYFQSLGTAQKRLRRLFDAGLVSPIVMELAAENRYAVTRLGHTLLERALDGVPPYRPPPRVDRRGLEHLDLLNGYRVALATGAAANGVVLERFVPDWELRATDPNAALVPDAAVRLAVGGRRIHVAIEVDVGTESLGVVQRKLARYEEHALLERAIFGLVSPWVVVITTTPRRARSLARAFASLEPARCLLGVAPSVLVDGGLTLGLLSPSELVRLDHVPAPREFHRALCALLRPGPQR